MALVVERWAICSNRRDSSASRSARGEMVVRIKEDDHPRL